MTNAKATCARSAAEVVLVLVLVPVVFALDDVLDAEVTLRTAVEDVDVALEVNADEVDAEREVVAKLREVLMDASAQKRSARDSAEERLAGQLEAMQEVRFPMKRVEFDPQKQSTSTTLSHPALATAESRQVSTQVEYPLRLGYDAVLVDDKFAPELLLALDAELKFTLALALALTVSDADTETEPEDERESAPQTGETRRRSEMGSEESSMALESVEGQQGYERRG
ncbi:uncharacterized protein LAESUDRAFT_728710 [Laetiporus sulphureus 93-53]|uniref:Uncharacterized protein n=1 Tax=Laetiporus sulphureus 93-53 TaxID=1314785 RepID=A0A165D207_9APHY|nr:uncharacterized protein LAESUDRAFT_728710 [Laetiporus sulphureus 93-53]KZT03995.1 hypothetical protein LAESUDRAFT_728710 [Laetiporus sulphureus 93-53]